MRESGLRRERLAAAVRETLSQLVLLEMKDPRLSGVVVSAVELSRDLKRAHAYFSVVGDAERERQAADALTQARGILRREVGRRLRLRIAPELTFERDRGFERADRVDRILGELSFSDEPPAAGVEASGEPRDGAVTEEDQGVVRDEDEGEDA